MSVDPGWYPDPDEEGKLRYWDGTGWTNSTIDSSSGQGASLPPVQPAPVPLSRSATDNRSTVGVFIGLWSFAAMSWWVGFGGLMLLISEDPPSPTVLMVSGVAFGAAIAAISARKATPTRITLRRELTAEVRADLKLAASELGLTVARDDTDVIEFGPRRNTGLSVFGLQFGPPPAHVSVHRVVSEIVIVGPQALGEKLAASVRI